MVRIPANAPRTTLTAQADDEEKYAVKIKRLFAPKLPFLYAKPVDYPPEQRSTRTISLIAPYKLAIAQYKEQFGNAGAKESKPVSKKQAHQASLDRQLRQWNDTEAFAENEFLKDPYRTVFVARLYYSLTEVDLSKHFTQFGSIESIRIVRDQQGRSRGYGFIVFEREADAKTCVRELAATGLSVEQPADSKPRKILVDRERGRLVRSWMPRRLGGGLGGRHYTLASSFHSRDASAASSGRRMNLSSNPYQQAQGQKRSYQDLYSSNKRMAPDTSHYQNSAPAFSSNRAYPAQTAYPAAYTPVLARGAEASIKDKYARYQSPRTGDRSINSIRQRE